MYLEEFGQDDVDDQEWLLKGEFFYFGLGFSFIVCFFVFVFVKLELGIFVCILCLI